MTSCCNIFVGHIRFRSYLIASWTLVAPCADLFRANILEINLPTDYLATREQSFQHPNTQHLNTPSRLFKMIIPVRCFSCGKVRKHCILRPRRDSELTTIFATGRRRPLDQIRQVDRPGQWRGPDRGVCDSHLKREVCATDMRCCTDKHWTTWDLPATAAAACCSPTLT